MDPDPTLFHFFLWKVFQPIYQTWPGFNSLPNDKIWDQSNLKAFADVILNVIQMMIGITDRVENIACKGEFAEYQHFLLFPQCFDRLLFQGQ